MKSEQKKYILDNINKKTIFLSILLIVTLGFAVYGNSLNGEFIWDDEHLILDNTYIKNFSHIPKIFTQDIGASGGREWNFYRPIQVITYVIDYSLWKLNVKGYHFTNILVHVLTALGIYCLINIIFNDNLLSLLTGMLFVVHPIHTEAVTYISGRADPLALLFMLLCFLFYIKDFPSKNLSMSILMLLSYMAALLSKENSLILPVLLLLYHYSFKKELKVKKFLSIASLALIYILLRATVLKALLPRASCTTTLFQRLPGFFVAVTDYIRLLFLPLGLHMEYGAKLFDLGDLKAVLGAVILFALLIYAFRKKEDNKLAFFSITWFLVALFPVSNLYPINAYMAEHWLYLPSIGFFLIAAKVISSLYRTKDFKIFAIINAIGSLTFYSCLTIRQNIYWRKPIGFYERILKYTTDSARVYNNLGVAYTAANKKEEAVTSYKKAIEIKADYPEAYNNLGTVYADMDKREEAMVSYKKAIAIKADYAEPYYNLGNAYEALNKNEEAAASYKRAIEIKADYAEAYHNLGIVHKAMNRNEEAVSFYKKAIEIQADFAEPYFNLGNVYKALNKNEEAIASYKKAIEIKTDYADAYHNLGVLYSKLNRNEEAITLYKQTIEINPNHAGVYNNLSATYFRNKQYQLAIEYCDKAINLGFAKSDLLEALKPYR